MSKLKGIFINTDGVIIPYQYEDSLKTLQAIVRGPIEYAQLTDRLYMIVNEEGKIRKLPVNKVATRLYDNRDVIVGNALIVATDGENNDDCNNEDLQYVLKKGKA